MPTDLRLRQFPDVVSFFWCGILLLTVALPAWPQPRKISPGNVDSSKCEFLRDEVRRVSRESQEFTDNSPLANAKSPEDLAALNASLSDWAGYVGASETSSARKIILRLAITACERTGVLSDPSRLPEIEAARASHVRRFAMRWKALAGEPGNEFEDSLSAQISAVYESETKSFYNAAMSLYDDRDIGKDYPDLASLIRSSALDDDTKTFYISSAHLLRYEEAGRLANALKGLSPDGGLNYAYITRTELANRVAADLRNRGEIATKLAKERNQKMIYYAVEGGFVALLLAGLWMWSDRARAKYRAFRPHAGRERLMRSPFWFRNAEWIFWEPGETVVLLERKRLVPMMDPRGGYRVISAWREQEYVGRVSYKTKFLTYESDPIHTSDGLAVHLGLGIWWRIADAGTYVTAIASEYHDGDHHSGKDLGEAAEKWINKLAAGTLREEINQLPAEQLISPYVQAYLQVGRGPEKEVLVPGTGGMPNFSQQLGRAQVKLGEKTIRYGIEIERLEVQKLTLPTIYQEKLEKVRVAFLNPSQARANTEAKVIALQGLASVLGPDKVGLIEILKHVDTSHLGMNPFTGVTPIIQPIINTLQGQTEGAMSPNTPAGSPLAKRPERNSPAGG